MGLICVMLINGVKFNHGQDFYDPNCKKLRGENLIKNRKPKKIVGLLKPEED